LWRARVQGDTCAEIRARRTLRTVSAWSTAYPQSASCWITAGSAFSERRLGRLMARNDPAISGRNRICCNNIARFRTTPAAGRRVSRPPVTTSTRATGSQATDSAYAVRSPVRRSPTIRSRRAQPGPLNLHEYRHGAGRRRWPGMRRQRSRDLARVLAVHHPRIQAPSYRVEQVVECLSSSDQVYRGRDPLRPPGPHGVPVFSLAVPPPTGLSSFMRRSVIVWPDPTRTRGVPLHASVRVRSCDANHRWPGATRRRVASFAAIPPYLANMRR
jgi:hypothetical protein